MSDFEEVMSPERRASMLFHASELAKLTHGAVMQELGRITLEGATPDQELLDTLADIYEGLREMSLEGLDAINQIPIPRPKPDSSPEQAEPIAVQVPAADTETSDNQDDVESEPQKSAAEPEPEEEAAFEPTEVDIRLIEYIESAQEVNIGKLIFDLYEERLDPESYEDLIGRLNYLADLGYIYHEAYTPNYGAVKQDEQSRGPVSLAKVNKDEVGTDETQSDPDEDDSASEEEVVLPIELSEVELAVVEYAKAHPAFRVEEMRREQSVITALSDEDYELFKKTFRTEGMQRIVQFIREQGGEAEWLITGKARGTRYNLLYSEEPITAKVEEAKAESTQQTLAKKVDLVKRPQNHIDLPYYDRLAQQQAAVEDPEEAAGVPVEELTPHKQLLQAARFTIRLTASLRGIEENGNGIGIRRTQIVRDIAKILGISEEAARTAVGNLQEAGHVYEHPSRKGTKIISTFPYEADDDTGPKGDQASVSAKERERQRITELRSKYETRIVLFLDRLDAQQSEYKTAIAAAIGDEVSIEDINTICGSMASDGILIGKAAQTRGRGRTRKGKTWRLSEEGRKIADDLKSSTSKIELSKLAQAFGR